LATRARSWFLFPLRLGILRDDAKLGADAVQNPIDHFRSVPNRAYTQRNGGLVDIKVDPLLRSLHGGPRYAAFLEKMRLPL
jgi:hypothetical protein